MQPPKPSMQKMSPQVPDEVLESIIRHHLSQDATDDGVIISNILRVCRRWHDVGVGTIWRDVVFRNPAQLSHFKAAAQSPNLALIRSLSITFIPLEPRTKCVMDYRAHFLKIDEDRELLEQSGNAATRDLVNSLQSICGMLPRMANLSSLSIRVGPTPERWGPTGFLIPRRVFHELVENLPESVEHLEIDTKRYERVDPDDKTVHLCTAIAARMKTLKSLRLRLGRICPAVFAPSATISSIIINMVEPDCTTKALSCFEVMTERISKRTQKVQQSYGRRTCEALVAAGLTAKSSMPNLSQFLILDAENFISRQLEVDFLRIRDLLLDQTTTFPIFDADGNEALTVLRKPQQDGVGEDIVGNIALLEADVEVPSWSTTVTGSRVPPVVRTCAEANRHTWSEVKACKTRKEFEQLPVVPEVPFWRMEREAGRQLIQTTTQDGVIQLQPSVRDTYEVPTAPVWEED